MNVHLLHGSHVLPAVGLALALSLSTGAEAGDTAKLGEADGERVAAFLGEADPQTWPAAASLSETSSMPAAPPETGALSTHTPGAVDWAAVLAAWISLVVAFLIERRRPVPAD